MAGSICLLLWGSFTVRQSVEEGFAATLRGLLIRAADNSPVAIFYGVIAALAMQSATAATVLGLGFLSSGLMSSATTE